MRRKQFRTVCGNTEWQESSENYGLILPSRRIFSPNLSKSAPCNCCGTTTQSNCADCAAAYPTTMHIVDSTQGRSIANNLGDCCRFVGHNSNLCSPNSCTGGQLCFIDKNFSCTGRADCTVASTSTITTCVSYTLRCGGTPASISFLLGWTRCNSTADVAKMSDANAASSSFTITNGLALPRDCGLSSSLTFNIPASSPALSPWPSGGTITLSR